MKSLITAIILLLYTTVSISAIDLPSSNLKWTFSGDESAPIAETRDIVSNNSLQNDRLQFVFFLGSNAALSTSLQIEMIDLLPKHY